MTDFEKLPAELQNRIINARDEGWAKIRDQADTLDKVIEVYEQCEAESKGGEHACAQFVLDCLFCIRGELKYRNLTGNID